jgi:hypothetical protein
MPAFTLKSALLLGVATGLALTSAVVAGPKIGVPAPLSGKADPTNSLVVTLTWANIDGETGYVVERKPSTSTSFVQIAKVPTDQSTYKDTTPSSENYQYRVRAYMAWKGQVLYSDYTNPVAVSTIAPTATPMPSPDPTSSQCLESTRVISTFGLVSGSHNEITARDATIDLRGQPISANPAKYPMTVQAFGNQVCVTGHSVKGRQSASLTWNEMKSYWDGNGLFFNGGDASTVTFENSYVENVEDGFSARISANPKAKWVLRGVYMKNIRDDAIENDGCLAGEIHDSLFDGVHMFLSERPGKDSENSCAVKGITDTLTVIRNSLVRMVCQADSRSDNSCTVGTSHAQLFKQSEGSGPVDIRDTIFLVPSLSANGPGPMAFPKGTYSNVTLIWLGGGPYPGRLPATGVRVTNDISIWNNARAKWLADHGCTADGSRCSFTEK